MSEIDIFEEVLNNFIQKYNLIIERPYKDTYLVIKLRSGYVLGEMDYRGYNLLYNLNTLCKILECELE